KPARTYSRKLATVSGARPESSSMTNLPMFVSTCTFGLSWACAVSPTASRRAAINKRALCITVLGEVRVILPNAARMAAHADLQLVHRPQGRVQTAPARRGAHVPVRRYGLRLLPHGSRAVQDCVRHSAPLFSVSRLPGDLRPQHHGHRRQHH